MLITSIVTCACVFLFLPFLGQQAVDSFFLHFLSKNILLFCTPNPSSPSSYAMPAIPSHKKKLLQRYKDQLLKASKVTIDFTRILQRYVAKGLNIKTRHKIFWILFTYFLREIKTVFNFRNIFYHGFKEGN